MWYTVAPDTLQGVCYKMSHANGSAQESSLLLISVLFCVKPTSHASMSVLPLYKNIYKDISKYWYWHYKFIGKQVEFPVFKRSLKLTWYNLTCGKKNKQTMLNKKWTSKFKSPGINWLVGLLQLIVHDFSLCRTLISQRKQN